MSNHLDSSGTPKTSIQLGNIASPTLQVTITRANGDVETIDVPSENISVIDTTDVQEASE